MCGELVCIRGKFWLSETDPAPCVLTCISTRSLAAKGANERVPQGRRSCTVTAAQHGHGSTLTVRSVSGAQTGRQRDARHSRVAASCDMSHNYTWYCSSNVHCNDESLFCSYTGLPCQGELASVRIGSGGRGGIDWSVDSGTLLWRIVQWLLQRELFTCQHIPASRHSFSGDSSSVAQNRPGSLWPTCTSFQRVLTLDTA